MTPQEKLEYNKRCAEFLGYVNTTPTDKDFNIYKNEKGMIIGNNIYTILETMSMKFHSDWNWIMEVVEAIEKLYSHPNKEINIDIKPGQIEIFQRPFYLENNNYHEVIYLSDGYINSSKKEAVVQAIDQFLIWYNEQRT